MLPAPTSTPRTGRPRALDEVKRREVCALISAGCGIEGAAHYVGCVPSTIRREAIHNADFNDQLRRANLSAELGPLNAMRQAAQKHWRAAAWLLERTNAQRFAKQNVRLLKPEQLEYYNEAMANILLQETTEPEIRRRVLRRLKKLLAHTKREVIAADLDPLPKPRRPRQRKLAPGAMP